jgi:DNA-directed RNA polymerase beta' subunit
MDRPFVYDQFIKSDNLDKCVCGICLDVVYEPRMLTECGHIYCKECLEGVHALERESYSWYYFNKREPPYKCGVCNVQSLTIIKNLWFETNVYNLLKYVCADCDTVIELGHNQRNFISHAKSCELKKCKYCDVLVPKKDIDDHYDIQSNKFCNNMRKCMCGAMMKKLDFATHKMNCITMREFAIAVVTKLKKKEDTPVENKKLIDEIKKTTARIKTKEEMKIHEQLKFEKMAQKQMNRQRSR